MIRTLRARLQELEGPDMSALLMQKPLSGTTNGVFSEAQSQQSLVANPAAEGAQKHGVGSGVPRLVDNPSPTILPQTSSLAAADAQRRPQHDVASTESVHLSSHPKPLSSSSIGPTTFDALMKPLDLAAGKTHIYNSLPRSTATNKSSAVPRIRASCTCDQCLDTLCCDMPLRRQADALVEIFFSRHNRMFPVLHQGTFMKQYQWLWGSNAGAKSNQQPDCLGFCRHQSRLRLFPALLNAVFALGALFAYHEPEQGITKADAFFSKAWRVDLLELLDDEVGVEPIQLGLLMSLYLQSTERFSRCWNTLGLTVRIAQNKGLHFDTAEARGRGLLESCPSQLECEMRARLWCACVLLDTYVPLGSVPSLQLQCGLCKH